MPGLIQMYLYKMFSKKGIYILLGFIPITLLLSSMDAEPPTAADLICQLHPFFILLLAVYTAVFFAADISCGFLKNYAGTLPDRSRIIGARTVTAVIPNILVSVLVFLFSVLFAPEKGDMKTAVLSTGCFLAAGIAYSFFSILIVELVRKTIPVVILSIVFSSGIACELLTSLVGTITGWKVVLKVYLLTGVTGMAEPAQMQEMAVRLLVISAVYIAVSLTAGLFSIKKRDLA